MSLGFVCTKLRHVVYDLASGAGGLPERFAQAAHHVWRLAPADLPPQARPVFEGLQADLGLDPDQDYDAARVAARVAALPPPAVTDGIDRLFVLRDLLDEERLLGA